MSQAALGNVLASLLMGAAGGGGGGERSGGGRSGGGSSGSGDKDKDNSDGENDMNEPKTKARRTKLDAQAKIDTRSSFLYQFPLCRLQGLIEVLHPAYDAIATDTLTRQQCLMLIFILSGVKSNLGVTTFRNLAYEDFYKKMVTAAARLKDEKGRAKCDQIIFYLNPLTPEKVEYVARSMGYLDEWMSKPRVAKAKAKPKSQMSAPPLPLALQDANATLDSALLGWNARAPPARAPVPPQPPYQGGPPPAPAPPARAPPAPEEDIDGDPFSSQELPSSLDNDALVEPDALPGSSLPTVPQTRLVAPRATVPRPLPCPATLTFLQPPRVVAQAAAPAALAVPKARTLQARPSSAALPQGGPAPPATHLSVVAMY